MLSKVGLLAKACGVTSQRGGSRLMSGYAPKHPVPKFATYNDLPIPSGSWQEAYSKKQMRYNIYLLSSVLFSAATWTTVYFNGTLHFLRSPQSLGPFDD